MNPSPDHVKLGRLSSALVENSVWQSRDEFPAFQPWANELESALEYLESVGELNRYWPRISGRERDPALAEVWSAFYFHNLGISISHWEPEYVDGIPGDYELRRGKSAPVFVEVKCPRWQGELKKEELNSGRKLRPKYFTGDVRSYDNVGKVVYAVDKALPKFKIGAVNIVVVVDDLFVSPLIRPFDLDFEAEFRSSLAAGKYDRVSGVFLLKPFCGSSEISYRHLFFRGNGVEVPGEFGDVFC